MCDRTPRVGETWIFRKRGGDTERSWGPYAEGDQFTVTQGQVTKVTADGVGIKNLKFACGGEPDENWGWAKIRWAAGWEPFLRLDTPTEEPAADPDEELTPEEWSALCEFIRDAAPILDRLAKLEAVVEALRAAPRITVSGGGFNPTMRYRDVTTVNPDRASEAGL